MKSIFHASIKSEVITSHEIEILLCCARTFIDPLTAKRVQALLKNNIDWQYLIRTAIHHGVIPLLYKNLKLSYSDSIPEDILQQLRSLSHRIALSNAITSKDLFEILELFSKNGIRVIPFKGIILAASIYGDLGLRHFCDLDILVSKKDFFKAYELLIHQGGYQPSWQFNLLNKDLEVFLIQGRDECSLTNGTTSIDLHQVLTAQHFFSSRFEFEDLWSRLEPVSISGHSVRSFEIEDLFFYLCIHGAKECWRSLKWICDIAELISHHPNMDWVRLIRKAQQIGCERIFLLSILLAHVTIGTDLPSVVESKIQGDRECQNLAREFSRRLFSENNDLSNRLTLKKAFIQLKMVDTLKDKCLCLWDLRRTISQYIIKCIPNKKDKEFMYLPNFFYFLYYFIRPIRIVSNFLIWTKNS